MDFFYFIFFFKYFNTELYIFWTLHHIKARPNKKNLFRVTILNLNCFVKPVFSFFSLMVLLGFYIYAKYMYLDK